MRKTSKILFFIHFLSVAFLGYTAARAAEGVTPVVVADIPLTAPLVTTAYVPLLPFGADATAPPQYLPVGSNHPMDEDHTSITRAIIAVHDQTRDAQDALELMETLAGTTNDTTLILAPQFLLEADILRFMKLLPEHGKMFARWALIGTSSPWEDGGNSVAISPQKGISSFTALDVLMLYLSDRQRFPHLQQIVIAGHGTGGEFVQRYAAVGQAASLLDRQHIPVRYVVSNPASYLYFTAMRPQNGKSGFTPPDAAACPDYNNYKYGLEHLNPYAMHLGANAIKLRYASRNIIYILGEKVVAQDTTLDGNCAAQLQGSDRMARAEKYAQYLNLLFGDSDANQQNFVKVPKTGFDPSALFGSRCGMTALFGDGLCK